MNNLIKLVTISGCLIAWNCSLADYYFDPRFSSTQRFDTNLRMIAKPNQDNWITTFSPGVDLGYRHENGEFKTKFTWNELIYDNQTELNIDEQLLNVSYQHTTEKFNWGLETSYNSQSNLTTNFLFTESQDEAIQLLRKNLTVAPSLSYSINEQTNLSISYIYNDLTYEKNPNVRNLYDYTFNQGSVGINHMLTERDKLSFTVSTALLDMPAIEPSVTSISQSQISQTETAQIGWEHSFNEQLIASFAFGMNYSETESSVYGYQGLYIPIPNTKPTIFFDPTNNQLKTKQKYKFFSLDNPTNTAVGEIFNASIQKMFERGNINLSASQQLSPTAQGNQTITQFDILGSYKLNERWQLRIDGRYQLSTFPVTSTINSQFGGDRTYYSISPKISWQWTPELSLQLSYIHRIQTLDSFNQREREGNAAQLQFNYQPQINNLVK